MKSMLAEDNGARLWHIWQRDGRDLAADVTALSDVALGLGTWQHMAQQLASTGWEPTAADGWEVVDYADIAEAVRVVATWDGTLSVDDPGPYARLALGAEDARQRPTRDEIAADWDLWTEYVDPAGAMTQEAWLAMTVAERVAMQESVFGDVR